MIIPSLLTWVIGTAVLVVLRLCFGTWQTSLTKWLGRRDARQSPQSLKAQARSGRQLSREICSPADFEEFPHSPGPLLSCGGRGG